MLNPESIDTGFTTRAVVPGQCVRVGSERTRVSIPASQEQAEAHVEIIRDGKVVQAIEITCSCGQHIRISCDYEQPSTGGPVDV